MEPRFALTMVSPDLELLMIGWDKYEQFAGTAPWSEIVAERDESDFPPLRRDDVPGYIREACLVRGPVSFTRV